MNIKIGVITSKLAMAFLAVAMAAGTSFAQDKGGSAQQNSGFLSDYARLTPATDNPNTRRWVSKDFDFKPYQQIMLDPVEVWVNPTSEYKGVSPDALKHMSDSFAGSFKKALQPGYQLVDKPGPGVLRIRLAITGVNLVKPPMKPYQVLPILLIARAASSSRTVALTAEMEVLGPDNTVVAAAVATGTGDKTVDQKKEVTWADMQSIADNWGKNLRRRLDEVRGVAAPKS